LEFFVYENWPDMAPFLNNGFPPSEDEWADYLAYMNGDFHDWFLEYYYAIAEAYPNSCVKMIPVGPVINSLLTFEPFNQIPIEELYEDDAPHGRSTIYFLGALATYMAMYAEKPPSNFEVDAIIHPIIQQNLDNAIEYIFSRLIDFTDQDGKNIAFCSDTPASTNFTQKNGLQAIVYPNPTNGELTIDGLEKGVIVEIFRVDGTIILKERKTLSGPYSINLHGYPNGLYQLVVRDNTYHIVFEKKICKIVD
ncbi:MAG: T9SS type A sorting domain-containing protein, partial [Saprospiraceae bacterium]|nr:T9SS type A sorting domain-containing protein [Saprospiraceae bacterium]